MPSVELTKDLSKLVGVALVVGSLVSAGTIGWLLAVGLVLISGVVTVK